MSEIPLNEIINQTDIISAMWKSLPPEILNKISLMLNLSIAISIAILSYVIISILIKIWSFFRSFKGEKNQLSKNTKSKNPKY